MRRSLILLWIFHFGFIFAQEVDQDYDVSLILVGMRHGNRHPGNLIKEYSNEDLGDEGLMMLTSVGKEQAYGLGTKLRSRYVKLLTPEKFNNTRVKGVSSSAERCQMTLQTMFYGLFADPNINDPIFGKWQPVPYKIDNLILRMYAVDECIPQKDSWGVIDNETMSWLREWRQQNGTEELMAYVSNATNMENSFSSIADVADNLMNIKHKDANLLPDWVKSSTLEGKEGQNIYDDIHKFAEAPQIACAKHGPCKKMMGGYWLNEMLEVLEDKGDKKAEEGISAMFYASHTEITLSVMYLMDVSEDEIHEMPTSAGFIIEYKHTNNTPKVRILHHYPDPTTPQTRLMRVVTPPSCKDSESSEWCTLSKWKDSIKNNMISDIKETCLMTCDKGTNILSFSLSLLLGALFIQSIITLN